MATFDDFPRNFMTYRIKRSAANKIQSSNSFKRHFLEGLSSPKHTFVLQTRPRSSALVLASALLFHRQISLVFFETLQSTYSVFNFRLNMLLLSFVFLSYICESVIFVRLEGPKQYMGHRQISPSDPKLSTGTGTIKLSETEKHKLVYSNK